MCHVLHAQGNMAGGLPNGKVNGRAAKNTSTGKENLINGNTPSEKQATKKRPASNAEMGGAVRKR